MADRDHSDVREQAHQIVAGGVAMLAHAFNACDNPDIPYRYDAQSRRRFIEIVGELRELVDAGRIIASPLGIARQDAAFQRFLSEVTTRRRKRRAV